MISRAIQAGLLLCTFLSGIAGVQQGVAGAESETGDRKRQRSILVQRKNVFAFTHPPAVRKVGRDAYEITFAVKDDCDVAVAVEDRGRRILRHLACGLLGPTAPDPLVKNALRQTIAWDGKDDWGRYVDRTGIHVRVSLGLTAAWERAFDWLPENNVGHVTGIGADEDGVYVLTTSAESVVRMFDHAGRYLRTVYPFPADKVGQFYRDPATSPRYSKPGKFDHWLDETHGLPFERYPDGARAPVKQYSPWGEFVGFRITRRDLGVYGMALSKGRLVLPSTQYNGLIYFGTDGGPAHDGESGTLPLFGLRVMKAGMQEQPVPSFMSASPDGKWLYATGFITRAAQYGQVKGRLHGVLRVPLAADIPPVPRDRCFIGEGLHPRDGDDGINDPHDIATDAAGNLYVANTGNNRISVFSPAAKLIRNIPLRNPIWLDIDPKTGAIYALAALNPLDSRSRSGRVQVVVFSPLPEAKERFRQDFPVAGRSRHTSIQPFCVDFWADRPTVWMTADPGTTVVYEERDGKFVLKKDFGAVVRKAHAVPRPFPGKKERVADRPITEGTFRVRAFYDPVRNKVYRGDGAAFQFLRRFDAATGRLEALIRLPFMASDAAFDGRGRLFLRGHLASTPSQQYIVRYDPETMTEVPFDYGEPAQLGGTSIGGAIVSPVMSERPFDSGMAVSKFGEVYVQGTNMQVDAGGMVQRRNDPNAAAPTGVYAGRGGVVGAGFKLDDAAYRPKLYPGRVSKIANVVFVYNAKGQMIAEDLIKGLTHASAAIATDLRGNIFTSTSDTGFVFGKPYGDPFWGNRGVLYRFPPTGGRFLAPRAEPVRMKEPPEGPPAVRGSFWSHPGPMWVKGAEWFFPGIGTVSHQGCRCMKNRPAVDWFGRVFVPEADRYSIAVLDGSGMVIHRFGAYGNPDDGRAAGKGYVPIAHIDHVAVATDQRLFAYDRWNKRMVSAKLSYHTEATAPVRGTHASPSE